MAIWKELLGSFEGQLSLLVVLFMLAMMVYFARLFIKKAMQQESKK
jgi:uncharacterized membrane protein